MNSPLKCLLKLLTGYDCPFCGAQRAVQSLLQGDVSSAFHYNPFLFIIAPYLIMVLLCAAGIIRDDTRLRKFLYHKATIACAAVLTIFWWIFRNTGYGTVFG